MEGKRNCVFTNQEARSKVNIIPKELAGSEMHNWTNSAPSNFSYAKEKNDRLPTENELELNEVFHYLELAKLRVKFYELKMQELQQLIAKEMGLEEPKKIAEKLESKKEKEFKAMEVERDLQNIENKIIEQILDKKKEESIWGR